MGGRPGGRSQPIFQSDRPCDGDPRRVGAVAKRLEGSPERLRRDRRFGRDSGAQRHPSQAPLVNDCALSNKSRQKRPSDLHAHEYRRMAGAQPLPISDIGPAIESPRADEVIE